MDELSGGSAYDTFFYNRCVFEVFRQTFFALSAKSVAYPGSSPANSMRRRFSIILAVAAALITAAVLTTYAIRVSESKKRTPRTPDISPTLDAVAQQWTYGKDDPKTNRPVVRISAKSFAAANAPSAVALQDVRFRLYEANGDTYTFVHSESAAFQDSDHIMRSHGPVRLVMNVPDDKNAENNADIATLVQVRTSGVTYNTDTGAADTNDRAQFIFPKGGGSATGVSYDPKARELILKSGVAMQWTGNGPAASALQVQAGHLRYLEREHKIYLSPWSKLVRQGTTIVAADSVIQIDSDGVIQRVDAVNASGKNERQGKTTTYKADTLTAFFDDQGGVKQIAANGHAVISAAQQNSNTAVTADKALLDFAVQHTTVNGLSESESVLSRVGAQGNAVATSSPGQGGTSGGRVLRSQHIELAMNSDGKTIREIRSPTQSTLEFQPAKSGDPRRVLDSSSLVATYGDDSYIRDLRATNATTHTFRPATEKKKATEGVTTSDTLSAKFQPASNQVASIDQSGHFTYKEGTRQAHALSAKLDEAADTITLKGSAQSPALMTDDTGTISALTIFLNQDSGDLDASGRVISVRLPGQNGKSSSSVLDPTKILEAKADQMTSRSDNTQIVYDGNAAVWQEGNSIRARRIEIDRDTGTLHAVGNVVSTLKDANPTGPISVVRAPELRYADAQRMADYTGGVTLTRAAMTVTSSELKAFLTPKDQSGKSSLDHAFADGNVVVHDVLARSTRVGRGEHAEYFPKIGKTILSGGEPLLSDTRKGDTRGEQITYFSDDDRMIVLGRKGDLALTHMTK